MSNLPALVLLLCRLSLLSAKCSSGQWQCEDTSCILREKVSPQSQLIISEHL